MNEYKKKNRTGIPDAVKTQFESRSGYSFDDVRVHYNSGMPAQLQALAYTQGNQIYIGAGQEKYLRHELVHVVQQKSGSVKANTSYNGVKVNNDSRLERDADSLSFSGYTQTSVNEAAIQLKTVALSDTQWAIVQAAKTAALKMLNSIKGGGADRIFEDYFHKKIRKKTFREQFIAPIRAAINNLSRKNFRYDTGDGGFAAVYPDDSSHIIYLGSEFWRAPLTGINSQAGTLIHEASHWEDVLGTDDHAYGNEGTAGYDWRTNDSLRQLDTRTARDNADSLERIVEVVHSSKV